MLDEQEGRGQGSATDTGGPAWAGSPIASHRFQRSCVSPFSWRPCVRGARARRGAGGSVRLGLLARGGLPVDRRGVAPEHFELVVGAGLAAEDVADDVDEVDEDPAAAGLALDAELLDPLLLEVGPDPLGDGPELPLAGAGAQDEEVGDLGQLAQVEDQDVLGLELVADAGAGDGGGGGGQEAASLRVTSICPSIVRGVAHRWRRGRMRHLPSCARGNPSSRAPREAAATCPAAWRWRERSER